jgi:hypothetical protein
LAKGFEQISIDDFAEGGLPRKLHLVVQKKAYAKKASLCKGGN